MMFMILKYFYFKDSCLVDVGIPCTCDSKVSTLNYSIIRTDRYWDHLFSVPKQTISLYLGYKDLRVVLLTELRCFIQFHILFVLNVVIVFLLYFKEYCHKVYYPVNEQSPTISHFQTELVSSWSWYDEYSAHTTVY